MRDFVVRVPRAGYHDYIVIAENEEDAIEQVVLGDVECTGLSNSAFQVDEEDFNTDNWEVRNATP